MCIRDSQDGGAHRARRRGRRGRRDRLREEPGVGSDPAQRCLLYTSDAADERSSVDLGGRRIIKKKNTQTSCV